MFSFWHHFVKPSRKNPSAKRKITRHMELAPPKNSSTEDIYWWIKKGISLFPEWYQPVDFGRGVIAHVTTPPDWQPRPELVTDITRGEAKWNYIVRQNLPSIKGKRVLDLGCSSGLYSLKLAQLGAKEVLGIDRNEIIEHRSTNTPPPQDVIAQAKFVQKGFEFLKKRQFPVRFLAQDIGEIEKRRLGQFDFILALCVVYHELDQMPKLIRALAGLSDVLVLQANTTHGGELGKWASVPRHIEILLAAGFREIKIDAPRDYPLPMIVARKKKR